MPIAINIQCTTTLVEKIIQNRIEQTCILGKVQDYKDGNGLQFIKFDFVAGYQEIKSSIPDSEILNLWSFMYTFLFS